MRRDAPNVGGPDAAFPLPREITPPPDAWAKIAARLEQREEGDGAAGLLPADVPPPVDLWPAIAARLARDRGSRRGRAALAAAAAVALVAVVFVATRVPEVQPSATRPERAADLEPTTSRGAWWMLQEPEVSDDVVATMRRELALLHDERLRIEEAIDRDPDNASLRELWAYTYRVELDLSDTWTRTVMAYQTG
jgi:hypothetical protein